MTKEEIENLAAQIENTNKMIFHRRYLERGERIDELEKENQNLKEKLLMFEDLPPKHSWSWNTEHDAELSVERYDAAKALYESRPYEATFSELTFDEVLYLRSHALSDLHLQPNIVNVSNRLQILKCLFSHIENRNTWHASSDKHREKLRAVFDEFESAFHNKEKISECDCCQNNDAIFIGLEKTIAEIKKELGMK